MIQIGQDLWYCLGHSTTQKEAMETEARELLQEDLSMAI
jgi:hypothetical protein